MAITTVDGVIANELPPNFFCKSASGALTTGKPFTNFYLSGVPGAAIAPSPGLPGAALTSYAGQIPFPAAVGGKSVYLSKFNCISTAAAGAVSAGSLLICDRLWHNSGLSAVSTTAQTVNSATWPARDRNGSTNGDGVMIALEITATVGAGNPTITMSYTNQAGTSGQTGTSIDAALSGATTGTIVRMGLAAGDTGVRSIQSVTLSSSFISGSISLIAYRLIANIELLGGINGIDTISGSFPLCYNNTVPFLMHNPSSTSSSILSGSVVFAQG